MGLLTSLFAALFGTRSTSSKQEQPSELTAVAPDFDGFVSNRPRESDAAARPASAGAPTEQDHDNPAGHEALHARGSPPIGGSTSASELTALAPEFSGRVNNRSPTRSEGSEPEQQPEGSRSRNQAGD